MSVGPGLVRLQRVKPEDCRLLWEWANLPEVRAMSFETAPIPWESHQQWFNRKLQDPRCYFFLILDAESRPVGQIRLEEEQPGEATVSLSLAPAARGRGLGPQVLRLAAGELFRTTPVRCVHAYIKPDNQRSIRAFQKAGFRRVGQTRVKGQPAEHYIFSREDEESAADPGNSQA